LYSLTLLASPTKRKLSLQSVGGTTEHIGHLSDLLKIEPCPKGSWLIFGSVIPNKLRAQRRWICNLKNLSPQVQFRRCDQSFAIAHISRSACIYHKSSEQTVAQICAYGLVWVASQFGGRSGSKWHPARRGDTKYVKLTFLR